MNKASLTRILWSFCISVGIGTEAAAADLALPRCLPRAMPEIPKPPYLSPIVDPAFGSRITRISGDAGSSPDRTAFSLAEPVL